MNVNVLQVQKPGWNPGNFWRSIHLCAALSLLLFFSSGIQAQDVMAVYPVTNKILMIELKDGHIDPHGVGENASNQTTYVNPTNIGVATSTSTYGITSSNDANYTSSKNPIAVGRKSKAVDYNDQWQSVPFVWGHYMYIELPHALQQGKTYTIQFNNLVENKSSISFTYDVNKLRSPTVHVNQVGFPNVGPKYAYLSQWMGDFNTGTHTNGGLELDSHSGYQFRLINYATGSTVFTGTITKRMDKATVETASRDFDPEKNYSHADVWQCDFSSYTGSGEFVVAVDGIGCSYPFEIGNEVTREPFYYAMKGLFWQRHGIVKQLEDGQVMPRDHHPDDIVWKWDKNWGGGHDVSGFNTASPRVYGIWGYYHDAGDWDAYVTHAKVPMSLLMLYDLAPDKFYDGDVDNKYKLSPSDANWIDEGNNGVPDLLDEASWLIKYYQRARNVLKNNYGGTGGVPAYVGRDGVPGNNITAWQDTREWYLSKEDLEQTYLYAGLAAWYATCLNKFHQLSNTGNHPEYSSWINEATAAWNWANGKIIDIDNQRRARGFAAACLYRATGNTTYQTAFEDYQVWEPWKTDGEWSSPSYYDVTISIYAMIPAGHNGLNSGLQSTLISDIQTKTVDKKINNINANAFRCGMEYDQFMQLGGFTTPKLTLLPVAHKLSGDVKYLNAMKNVANYVLGGNQLNMTYLSGLGEHSDVWIFQPNGYLTSNYNSKVYSNEPYIGFTSYFGANGGASGYWFYDSKHSEYFSRTGAYPQAKDWPNSWPEGESKFHNRYSIQGGEFTVHQQNNYMIYTMGYIKAMSNASSTDYTHNTRPTVSLNLTEGSNFPKAGCDLTVTTSTDTRLVKYYYEWHYIGESYDKANGFKLTWVPPVAAGTNVLITAVAYDSKGRMTKPSDAGDKTVMISTSATCGSTSTSYSLTINASNGSVAKNPNKSTYNAGESVTLTATPSSGYNFSNWSGDASGSTNPLTITMNSNKSITANFTQISAGDCNTFEAESGYSGSGVSVVAGNGSTGSGYVDFGGQGTYAQWTVSVPSAGTYTLKFKYANGSGGNRQCALTANSSTVGNVAFSPTGGWQTWGVEEITATLNAGNNTIRLTANTSAGGPNLDSYEVCGGDEPVYSCNLSQAETSYSGSGVSVVSGNGSTGSGYVDFGGQGTYAQWTVNVPSAGSYTLKFRYANGSAGNRQCALTANNASIGNVGFGTSGGWQTWGVEEIAATLNAGNNTIRLTANTSAGGPNLDSYEVCGGGASLSMRIGYFDDVDNSNQNTPKYSIYPNPLVNGELSITLLNDDAQLGDRINMSIMDTMGRIFYANNLASQDYIHHKIDCSKFPKGVYFIKIDSKELKKTSKLLIE